MALKDWKKISNDYYDMQWENSKGEIVSVFEYFDSWAMTKRNQNFTIGLEKKFKTKAQAMKFAKDYMKSSTKKIIVCKKCGMEFHNYDSDFPYVPEHYCIK